MLDNCEHLVDDCAKVADFILRRCPRVHLVITSREPLGIGGEAIYRVPSLSLPAPGGGDVCAPESSDAVAPSERPIAPNSSLSPRSPHRT